MLIQVLDELGPQDQNPIPREIADYFPGIFLPVSREVLLFKEHEVSSDLSFIHWLEVIILLLFH